MEIIFDDEITCEILKSIWNETITNMESIAESENNDEVTMSVSLPGTGTSGRIDGRIKHLGI